MANNEIIEDTIYTNYNNLGECKIVIEDVKKKVKKTDIDRYDTNSLASVASRLPNRFSKNSHEDMISDVVSSLKGLNNLLESYTLVKIDNLLTFIAEVKTTITNLDNRSSSDFKNGVTISGGLAAEFTKKAKENGYSITKNSSNGTGLSAEEMKAETVTRNKKSSEETNTGNKNKTEEEPITQNNLDGTDNSSTGNSNTTRSGGTTSATGVNPASYTATAATTATAGTTSAATAAAIKKPSNNEDTKVRWEEETVIEDNTGDVPDRPTPPEPDNNTNTDTTTSTEDTTTDTTTSTTETVTPTPTNPTNTNENTNNNNNNTNTNTNQNTNTNTSTNSGVTVTPSTNATTETVNNTPSQSTQTTTTTYKKGGTTFTQNSAPVSDGAVSNNTQTSESTPITDSATNSDTTDLFESDIDDYYSDLENSSSNVGNDSSTGASGVIPIVAGLGAAAAVGVGAKLYKDRKDNNSMDLDEDSPTNDNKFWTEEESNVINSEKEDYADLESYNTNNNFTEPVSYTAKDNDYEDNDTWSMESDTKPEVLTDLLENN